jgi:hypothetical protein
MVRFRGLLSFVFAGLNWGKEAYANYNAKSEERGKTTFQKTGFKSRETFEPCGLESEPRRGGGTDSRSSNGTVRPASHSEHQKEADCDRWEPSPPQKGPCLIRRDVDRPGAFPGPLSILRFAPAWKDNHPFQPQDIFPGRPAWHRL